jgi:ABC-type sugar transport system ATPase subunit
MVLGAGDERGQPTGTGGAQTAATGPSTAPILELRNIAKSFGATQALEDVSLALHPGEVHALLGENGAGKSTLIKIMTGVYQPDRGEILLAGEDVAIRDTAEAQRHGIAAIYQEPMLFPDLNVAENIFISHQGRGAVGRLAAHVSGGGGDPRRTRRRPGRPKPGPGTDARRPAVGRDRQGHFAECPRAHHGRADRVALGARSRPAVQARPRPARPGGRHPLRQPPHGGGFRDRRQGHGLPRRPADLDGDPGRGDAAACHCRHGGARDGPARQAAPGAAGGRAALGGGPRPRGRVRGGQLRCPSRRGARLRRADRRGADGCRACPLRHRAGDRRDHPVRRPGGDGALARGGHAPGDRLRLGRQAPARVVAADVDLGQHHAPHSRPIPQWPRPDPPRRGDRHRGGMAEAPLDPHSLGRPACRQALRRQPAEGHAEQVAQHHAIAADRRRADPRHRRRRQGGGARHHRRTRERGHEHHAHLVRPARGARPQRPGPRDARRAGRWRSSGPRKPTRSG